MPGQNRASQNIKTENYDFPKKKWNRDIASTFFHQWEGPKSITNTRFTWCFYKKI